MENDIPIVGQPANIILWYPSVIVNCHCQLPVAVTLVVVTGFNNPACCGNCGKLYQVVGQPGMIQPEMKAQLQIILPAPPGVVQ